MIAEIPLSSDESEDFISQLGDLKYRFQVKYNDRSGVWTLDLSEDSTGHFLFTSVPLLVGEDLLAPYNYAIGSLTVIDNSSQSKDATSEDLGTRVILYYVSADEIL